MTIKSYALIITIQRACGLIALWGSELNLLIKSALKNTRHIIANASAHRAERERYLTGSGENG